MGSGAAKLCCGMECHWTAASVSIEPFEVSRWRLRRTRARMDFEWCFGTFVPCFGGQTTKGGQEPAKHGIDHTPDPVAMQWPCLPEHKLRTLRTRSVRRASGLVQTALAESALAATFWRLADRRKSNSGKEQPIPTS